MGTSTRRTPVQRRSRERVERALLAAERIVIEDGVDALSTRAVAAAADVPVATLYQYFEDRDAIIRALIERQVEAMDERLTAAVLGIERYSVRTLVETTVGAYVAGYRDYPSFVVLWFQGRVNPEIVAYVRARTYRIADDMRAFCVGAGIFDRDVDALPPRLAGEMIDAFLAVAYSRDLRGDRRVVSEGIDMITGYLERYATPQGVAGIPRDELAVGWRA
ncbi:MAG TPA: TetR/AcrR family transcriptional regulator [Solirubrobacteraceae bacterium]